jgi:CRP-like cAMP-binding protein
MLSVEALMQTPEFAGLDRDAVVRLWALGKVTQCRGGVEIFSRGHEARELLIVESGLVDLVFPLQVLGAEKELVVERLGPGDILGWSALINPYVLTLSARSVEACAMRTFGRAMLQAYLKEHPQVGHILMENLAALVGRRLQRFQELMIREVQTRIVGLFG